MAMKAVNVAENQDLSGLIREHNGVPPDQQRKSQGFGGLGATPGTSGASGHLLSLSRETDIGG